MNVLLLLCVTAVALHLCSPFPSFFKITSPHRPSSVAVAVCVAHAILEETLFRHLFWNHFRRHTTSHYVSLLWVNVLMFWLMHVLLIYGMETVLNQGSPKLYFTTSYHMSIVFAGIFLNAVYLEATLVHPLVQCIAMHAMLLLVWECFLGGDDPALYEKYKFVDARLSRP